MMNGTWISIDVAFKCCWAALNYNLIIAKAATNESVILYSPRSPACSRIELALEIAFEIRFRNYFWKIKLWEMQEKVCTQLQVLIKLIHLSWRGDSHTKPSISESIQFSASLLPFLFRSCRRYTENFRKTTFTLTPSSALLQWPA